LLFWLGFWLMNNPLISNSQRKIFFTVAARVKKNGETIAGRCPALNEGGPPASRDCVFLLCAVPAHRARVFLSCVCLLGWNKLPSVSFHLGELRSRLLELGKCAVVRLWVRPTRSRSTDTLQSRLTATFDR
jgi:hypothetical protein